MRRILISQGGKLPLPPLVLSKDGSYLIDAKSPLTRKEFETLFRSTSRVDEIRRIAKKRWVLCVMRIRKSQNNNSLI